MSDPTRLSLQAGEPYSLAITVTDLTDVWPDLDDMEARMQIRSGQGPNYPLVSDLTEFLTPSIVGDDIRLTLSLTGEDTREVGSGYYDLFVSDTGVTDVRSFRVIFGRFDVAPAITAAS